jgi:DNA-binding response OmpR family regulator
LSAYAAKMGRSLVLAVKGADGQWNSAQFDGLPLNRGAPVTAQVDLKIPKTLLIVEDQAILAMALQCELEDGGYRVLQLADHHQEAPAIARQVKPDLALVNIGLADGDDVVALARDLKAMGVPVLFISGQPDKAMLAKAVGIASLPKPYSLLEMVEAVDYLFRRELGDVSVPAPQRLEMFENVGP